MDIIPIYTEKFYLSAGECNAEQEMSIPLLVAKLIDIATAHANMLHIGNPDMTDIHGGWVLSRLTIEMSRLPLGNETYSISTWVESFNRHFSERAFAITDANGVDVGYARSVWMIINTETHEPLRLDHFTLPDEIMGVRPCPIPRQAKHLQIVDAPAYSGARGTVTATHPNRHYTFAYCDLDYYRHVNTVRYVTLLLNQFRLEEYDEAFVHRLELSFLREAHYGMDVLIRRADDDESGMSSFFLTDSADDKAVLYGRVALRKRNEI